MQALFDSLKPEDPDWVLAEAIDPERLPAHIAIIMDGNGRWANRRSLPRVAGHKAGIGPVRSTVETCARMGIQALTLYAFSVENWKRPRDEVETLWRLLRYYLPRSCRICRRTTSAAGDRPAGCPAARRCGASSEAVIDATSGNRGLRVNLAINYGGRAEIGGCRQCHPRHGAARRQHRRRSRSTKTDRRAPLHRRHSRSRSADPHLRAKCASAISCCGRSPMPSCT